MISLDQLTTIGRDLDRPECVLCTSDGSYFVSHRRHGVARICADGTQLLLAPKFQLTGLPLLPNGIALRSNGSFLVANIADTGGIFELDEYGFRPFIVEIEGMKAPPINFITVDENEKIWFSVSSTLSPRHLAYRRDVKNGFVGVVENGNARVILDGLHYTNEIYPDLKNGWLYVSETFGQIISRFPIRSNGSLGERELFAQFPSGAFVDGIAMDEEDGIWAACIVSNELFHVPANKQSYVYLGERNADWIAEVEQALDANIMNRSHFDFSPATILRNISSVAFHGSDLRQIVCGNLLGDELVCARAPVKGRKPVHWDVQVPIWGEEFY